MTTEQSQHGTDTVDIFGFHVIPFSRPVPNQSVPHSARPSFHLTNLAIVVESIHASHICGKVHLIHPFEINIRDNWPIFDYYSDNEFPADIQTLST